MYLLIKVEMKSNQSILRLPPEMQSKKNRATYYDFFLTIFSYGGRWVGVKGVSSKSLIVLPSDF